MEKQEFKDRLDVVSRAGAIVLVALYGAGFLVVSFSNASYGIVEFGLFRTRLLSAGIIFAIFLALPFLEASRIFGLFGLRGIEFPTLTLSNQLFAFFTAAWASTFLMRFLVTKVDFSLRVVLIWISFPAIASGILVAKGFRVLPRALGSVIILMLCVGALVALILIKRWGEVGLLIWFMLVGWLTYQIDPPIRDPARLKQVNWIFVFLSLLMVFGYFSNFLYPKVEPMLGGGRPTHVVVYFSSTSPVDNSAKMEVWLVDETDDGYYFIRTPEDHKAIFVPRSLVSAIYFQDDKPTL